MNSICDFLESWILTVREGPRNFPRNLKAERVLCKYIDGWQNLSSNNQVTAAVKTAGIKSLCEKSEERKDNLHEYIKNQTHIEIHESCRIRYSKPQTTPKSKKRKLATRSPLSQGRLTLVPRSVRVVHLM